MLLCAQCGAESPDTARFCASCGADLSAACANCGAELPSGARFCPSCGTAQQEASPSAQPAAAPEPAIARAVEARKVVTILFCDVAGSTALGEKFDPESMRNVITTYFERIRAVIERHGGTVEKFIGDAIMAAFGIPVVHEDDALRAVRAAYEMREDLVSLGAELERDWGVSVRLRTGVNTGEVVAGDASTRETFATGDTVNTAARLEAAAPPGEILIGEDTYRLVRDAVEVEPVEPLELKGKTEPVPAYRLVAVYQHAEGLRRRLDSPLVGREHELSLLRAAFDAAVAERSCRLVTIYAPAGTGKSRLTRELIDSLHESATVLVGRCVPYGDGITYFPLALVVRELAGIDDEGSRAEARAQLEALFPDPEDAAALGRPLAVAIGLEEAVVRPEEIAWAARRLFERVATERPLVVVFEDIHWAEPTFLSLIEHVAAHTRESLLLVCPTRPDLLERAPSWGEFASDHLAVTLEPLGADECELLIANMLGTDAVSAGLRERIVEAAEGNPLYVEEMLRMLVDEAVLRQDDAGWVVAGDVDAIAIPPSIEAILAARIDRLRVHERALMQRAAVIGRVFGRVAVEHLTPPPQRPTLCANLEELSTKELVRPDAVQLAGDEAYRFNHILTRDAAYRGLPKGDRSDLHERFATWLEETSGERAAEV
jgi:class 3 adenylate cyclase